MVAAIRFIESGSGMKYGAAERYCFCWISTIRFNRTGKNEHAKRLNQKMITEIIDVSYGKNLVV